MASNSKPAISVCISLKNRSRVKHGERELLLFPNCVSLLAQQYCLDLPVELVVSDFSSDDWPLIEWLERAAADMPVTVIAIYGGFSRGYGLNVAADHARSDRLLLCDADIPIFATAFRRAVEVIDSGKAWLPISRRLDENGFPESWLDLGVGIVGVSRRVFERTGGVPEFRSWGGEDDIFATRVGNLVPVVRERIEGIRHQWHPEGCRYENYERPMRADYHDYCAVPTFLESMGGPSLFLLLFSNGRMERPGVDEGGYEYEEGKYLVLNWDRWPTERLIRDESRRIYRDAAGAFTLTPVAL